MPIHIENLRGRTEELLGCAMAIKTPFHAERLGLMDDIHLIDRTVATVAAHTTIHMHSMVEVGVIWQAMHLHPWDRLTGFPTLTHQGETRTIGKDLALAMAIDAGLSGRKIGMPGNLNKAMTVTAIHPELLDMKGVRKRHRLIWLIANAGIFRREVIPDAQSDGRAHNQHADQNLERQPIGPSGKEVRHRVIEIARTEN